MNKYVYLVILAMLVVLTINLLQEARQLRERVRQLEEERVRAANAEFMVGIVEVSDAEKERMHSIYQDIAQAYTNRDIMAMRIAMLKLPPVVDQLNWQIIPKIEKPLNEVFDSSFRLTTKLLDFDSPAQFDKFVKANTEVALFMGGLSARRKSFDFAASYETLSFERLKQYEEKFAREGKDELRDIAANELEFWAAWIESPNGFTRQYARYILRSTMEYNKIVKPELALSRDKALHLAYDIVTKFLKPTGYTPAWLSEFTVE